MCGVDLPVLPLYYCGYEYARCSSIIIIVFMERKFFDATTTRNTCEKKSLFPVHWSILCRLYCITIIAANYYCLAGFSRAYARMLVHRFLYKYTHTWYMHTSSVDVMIEYDGAILYIVFLYCIIVTSQCNIIT